MHVVLTDGTEFDVAAGDVFEIPPGHDAWVVGDTPYRAIDWVGARSWLANRTGRSAMIATILFTDVVDSSGEARRRGDLQWTDLNATLAERTRDVVVEYGGQVVKSTGDGTLAVFDAAGRAIRCGLELAALAPHLGLAIRVGVHTGEVETISGDIHGISVHEAARILGEAGAGEVLVSEVTRAIAGDAGLGYVDRGVHDLKGIGSRRLYMAASKGE
jgi:class 3 adenylate cyclase